MYILQYLKFVAKFVKSDIIRMEMCNFVPSKSEDSKMKRNVLNLRDLGGLPLTDGKGQTPYGLYLRSGKLSVCVNLSRRPVVSCNCT